MQIEGVGPRPAKIAIVGEFPDEDAALVGLPFSGTADWCLGKLLEDAGIHRAEVYITTFLKVRPEGGDLLSLCVGKKDAGGIYSLPPIKSPGKYLRPDIGAPSLEALRAELREVSPNIIIALGGAACWALTEDCGIRGLRGTILPSILLPGVKVLPTYPPSSILPAWGLRPITVLDLRKARRESAFSEIRPPKGTLWINPDIGELWEFWTKHLQHSSLISVDIETERRQITCIGFAGDAEAALVVPFWNKGAPEWSFWRSPEAEALAWAFVRYVMASPIPKLFQNGYGYDINFLLQAHGISTAAAEEDTMLLHHSLQPELEKGLGFLASCYLSFPAWKSMRKEAKLKDSEKVEE